MSLVSPSASSVVRTASHSARHDISRNCRTLYPAARIFSAFPPLFHARLSRTIFHVDMDAFFVSVEELFDPSLKGKAVVVGGQRDERGVVSAASYEARKFGVHSAMPLRTAAKMCPHAIFVDGHPERYRECSEKVHKVLGTFSPQVEMASIDEAYLDMTGTERLHGPPLQSRPRPAPTHESRDRLNCSVGIGTSRLIAKVCSAQAKPNGVLWIVPGEEAKFLAPLDVREIPGVGKVMEKHLHALGISKSAIWPASKNRPRPIASASGVSRSPAKRAAKTPADGSTPKSASDVDAKSISHEHTYNEDTADISAARIHPDAPFRNGRPPPARIPIPRPYHSAQTALQRFHHHHARPLRCRHPPNSTPKSSSRSALCFARIGKGAARFVSSVCRPPNLHHNPIRSTYWKATASNAGKTPWPLPIACATNSASPVSVSPPACVEASASASTRTPRAYQARKKEQTNRSAGVPAGCRGRASPAHPILIT